MKKYKTITRNYSDEVPPNYTGAVEYYHGLREYYLNGKLHRTDGPAVECDSDPSWNAYYILGEKTYKEAVEVFNWLFPEGPPQK